MTSRKRLNRASGSVKDDKPKRLKLPPSLKRCLIYSKFFDSMLNHSWRCPAMYYITYMALCTHFTLYLCIFFLNNIFFFFNFPLHLRSFFKFTSHESYFVFIYNSLIYILFFFEDLLLTNLEIWQGNLLSFQILRLVNFQIRSPFCIFVCFSFDKKISNITDKILKVKNCINQFYFQAMHNQNLIIRATAAFFSPHAKSKNVYSTINI